MLLEVRGDFVMGVTVVSRFVSSTGFELEVVVSKAVASWWFR